MTVNIHKPYPPMLRGARYLQETVLGLADLGEPCGFPDALCLMLSARLPYEALTTVSHVGYFGDVILARVSLFIFFAFFWSVKKLERRTGEQTEQG
jgi:hypothetical protein